MTSGRDTSRSCSWGVVTTKQHVADGGAKGGRDDGRVILSFLCTFEPLRETGNFPIQFCQTWRRSSTQGGAASDAFSSPHLVHATDWWLAQVSAPRAPQFKRSCHQPATAQLPPSTTTAAHQTCPRTPRPGLSGRSTAPRRAKPASIPRSVAPLPTAHRGPAWARRPRRSWSRACIPAQAPPPTRAFAAAPAVGASSAVVVVAAAAAVAAGRRRLTPDGLPRPCRHVACDGSTTQAERLSCRRPSARGGRPLYPRRH